MLFDRKSKLFSEMGVDECGCALGFDAVGANIIPVSPQSGTSSGGCPIPSLCLADIFRFDWFVPA
jgi:hypothetical protein